MKITETIIRYILNIPSQIADLPESRTFTLGISLPKRIRLGDPSTQKGHVNITTNKIILWSHYNIIIMYIVAKITTEMLT